MLNNKTFRVIASLVIAVLLWAYVIGTQNTSITQELSNIPITLTHTVELNERGLAVSNINLESIDVDVTGSRSLVNGVNASDVTATVDLATATKGENELNIVVRVPSSISGLRVSPKTASKAIVEIEDLVQKQVDVSITYTGTFDEGQAGDTVSIATPKVTVSGAESIVNTVASVRGTVDASRLSEDSTEITCQLQAVNAEGNQVSGVVLSQESVSVKSVLSQTKSVPVRVEIVDNSSDGMVRKTTIPENVSVVGRADRLASISYLEAQPVDITNIAEATNIPLTFELPEGISLSDRNDESSLAVALTLSPVETKVFNYTVSEIGLIGVSNRMVYTGARGTEIVLTVKDDADTLNGINKGSISLSCDVSNLSAGVYTLNLITECETKLYSIEANPKTIDVTITETDNAAARIQSALIAAAASVASDSSNTGNTTTLTADSDATNG